MSNFSFDATAGASQSSSRTKLEGNKIHDIVLEDCIIEDIQGVKDPSKVYKVLKLKFSNEDGYYEHTIFEPKESDFERKENEFTNKNGNVEKIPQPSNVDSMMLLLKHAVDAFAPNIAKEIDNGTKKLVAPNWEKLRELVTTILLTGKGTPSKIKLLKDKNGEAKFPGFFAGLSKEKKAYMKNNFIGNKLAFTSYEITRINNESSARVNQNSSTKTDFSLGNSIPESHDLKDIDLSSFELEL